MLITKFFIPISEFVPAGFFLYRSAPVDRC